MAENNILNVWQILINNLTTLPSLFEVSVYWLLFHIFLTRCMMNVNTHLLLDFCFFSWCTITPVFLLSIWQTNLFQYGTWRSGKERLYERIKPSQTYRSMMKKDAEDVFGDDRVRVTTILVCSLFPIRHTVTLSK